MIVKVNHDTHGNSAASGVFVVVIVVGALVANTARSRHRSNGSGVRDNSRAVATFVPSSRTHMSHGQTSLKSDLYWGLHTGPCYKADRLYTSSFDHGSYDRRDFQTQRSFARRIALGIATCSVALLSGEGSGLATSSLRRMAEIVGGWGTGIEFVLFSLCVGDRHELLEGWLVCTKKGGCTGSLSWESRSFVRCPSCMVTYGDVYLWRLNTALTSTHDDDTVPVCFQKESAKGNVLLRMFLPFRMQGFRSCAS